MRAIAIATTAGATLLLEHAKAMLLCDADAGGTDSTMQWVALMAKNLDLTPTDFVVV